ncbi:MAG TPA: penicillin-binding transpeptidase domain-containing protein [Candidatus Acidoferrales bacterium]|jgi:penicillin-binding protein 2|nr:penicillin-binding transpeptidase domain-containing protein [Candidatus Acidoferrales bacterium]
MLVVDELKKNDPQLRLLALLLAGGLFILLSGLWWVQVVSAREYQNHLEMQAYRTIRMPAVRGKILDREGRVLADNRARYNLSLYFDDLNDQFQKEYDHLRPVNVVTKAPPFWQFWSHAKTVTTNRARLNKKQMDGLMWQARYNVVSRIMSQVSQRLGQPLALDFKKFVFSYQSERAMPFTILTDLDGGQIARFQENFTGDPGANLVLQSVRCYPGGTTAAHLLGELRQDDSSLDGEESFFNYRLPDYRGITGVEGKYNSELHGHAGGSSVKVNSMGYRQSEEVDVPPVPGHNVTLTVDLDFQRAAEAALAAYSQKHQVTANAAVVVMDVRNGDVLAMASSPTFDPNDFAQGISAEKYARLQELQAEKNRATFENYAPGSIFKTVVALAALENGLNPEEYFRVQANPENPAKGIYYVGKRGIKDTAPPDNYNFKKAFIHSSNSYFINLGLNHTSIDSIIRMGKQFHLGERTGLFMNQETRGNFPTPERILPSSGWRDGDTANLCIGQGEIDVTPIQIAVMISAIANGGTVWWPRMVAKIEPQDPSTGEVATNFPAGLVRDRLTVHLRSLNILRDAMKDDVASSEGSGRDAAVKGLNIAAKTGTAQVQDERNRLTGHNYWFASYAPYESPKYAVVVLVQSATEGGSGGTTCGPIAHDIYEEILKKETAPKVLASAK